MSLSSDGKICWFLAVERHGRGGSCVQVFLFEDPSWEQLSGDINTVSSFDQAVWFLVNSTGETEPLSQSEHHGMREMVVQLVKYRSTVLMGEAGFNLGKPLKVQLMNSLTISLDAQSHFPL